MCVHGCVFAWVWVSHLGLLLPWINNTMTKNNQGRSGFIWLMYPESQSTEGSQGRETQTEEEPGSRSWGRGHAGVLLTGLLSLLSYSTQHCPPSPHTSITNQENALQACPLLWRYFLNWGSLLSDDSSLHKVDIKLGSSSGEHEFGCTCARVHCKRRTKAYTGCLPPSLPTLFTVAGTVPEPGAHQLQ